VISLFILLVDIGNLVYIVSEIRAQKILILIVLIVVNWVHLLLGAKSV
jgi:hypothetical protein